MVTVVGVVIHAELRLRLVQPEEAHAFVGVVLFAFPPYIFPRRGVCRVKEQAVRLELHGHGYAHLLADQEVVLPHLPEILRTQVDLGPYGNHKLDPHGLQFPAHRLRVGEEFLVKAVVAHIRPMEEIADNDIHGEPAPSVFPRHLQKLFLVPVAQLALPEAQAVFGHHGDAAGGIGIMGEDLRRIISRGDPVIQLPAAFSRPLGHVFGKGHAACRGVVPEKTVPAGGKAEGNRGLGVPVRQFQRTAFKIQVPLLILPHAVDLFILLGLKRANDFMISAQNGGVRVRGKAQGARVAQFFQEKFSSFIIETDLAAVLPPMRTLHHSRDAAVYHAERVPFPPKLHVSRGRGQKRIIGIQNIPH